VSTQRPASVNGRFLRENRQASMSAHNLERSLELPSQLPRPQAPGLDWQLQLPPLRLSPAQAPASALPSGATWPESFSDNKTSTLAGVVGERLRRADDSAAGRQVRLTALTSKDCHLHGRVSNDRTMVSLAFEEAQKRTARVAELMQPLPAGEALDLAQATTRPTRRSRPRQAVGLGGHLGARNRPHLQLGAQLSGQLRRRQLLRTTIGQKRRPTAHLEPGGKERRPPLPRRICPSGRQPPSLLSGLGSEAARACTT